MTLSMTQSHVNSHLIGHMTKHINHKIIMYFKTNKISLKPNWAPLLDSGVSQYVQKAYESHHFLALIMPRCACASEVYGSVFVCLCV